MRKKLVVAGLTTMLGLTSGIGSANAHSVGNASEPNCHGQRVSHGASDHGLTPKERADANEVSVREYHQFVKLCFPPRQ